MNKSKKENLKKGFTLLLASLVASLLLGIGLGIFSISFKEISLTSSNKESVDAFYSADTGIECALMYDFKTEVFATSLPYSSPPAGTVMCDGQDIASSWTITGNPNSAITTFNLTDSGTGTHCVTVVVNNKSDDTTEIDSRGYNTCDTSNPKRVERGIKVKY
jgi:hypothetical protein